MNEKEKEFVGVRRRELVREILALREQKAQFAQECGEANWTDQSQDEAWNSIKVGIEFLHEAQAVLGCIVKVARSESNHVASAKIIRDLAENFLGKLERFGERTDAGEMTRLVQSAQLVQWQLDEYAVVCRAYEEYKSQQEKEKSHE